MQIIISLQSLDGIDRPSLAVVLPTLAGPAVVLDVGANPDPKSEQLVQFALIGDEFAKALLGIPSPRVGLLSIGEEAGKGNELVRKAHGVLREQAINFIGNVEASDLYRGNADVVVCDGFAGNIMLKSSEAVVEMMRHLMRREFKRTLAGRLSALLARGTRINGARAVPCNALRSTRTESAPLGSADEVGKEMGYSQG